MAMDLPEVLRIAPQMDKVLQGRTIVAIHLSDKCASLIRQGFTNLHKVDLTGKTISSVTPRGKWMFLKLEPDLLLLFALETGGKLLYHPDGTSLPKKFHVRIEFDDGSFLTEQIVGWGWAKAVREDELELERYPGRIGVSPVDSETFTPQRFSEILDRHAQKALKSVLLRDEEIAGIGNGYLQDILFKAKVHPKRKAGSLDEEERMTLYAHIVQTMNEAVRLGGRDTEYDLYDSPGSYRVILDKRMRGEPCPECGTIEKLNVLGSTCYVCPSCQGNKG
jgi:formamidopyrimidine-DNA glycosylase